MYGLRSRDDEKRSVRETGLLLVGCGLVCVSLFMVFENVQVSGGFFQSLGLGLRGFGWSLLPLLLGIGWIVWQPRGLGGWLLALGGLALILFEILGSLTFYFPAGEPGHGAAHARPGSRRPGARRQAPIRVDLIVVWVADPHDGYSGFRNPARGARSGSLERSGGGVATWR